MLAQEAGECSTEHSVAVYLLFLFSLVLVFEIIAVLLICDGISPQVILGTSPNTFQGLVPSRGRGGDV